MLYGGQAVTQAASPPIGITGGIQWKGRSLFNWVTEPLQELPERCCKQNELPQGLRLPIFPKGCPLNLFSRAGLAAKQQWFGISVCLHLDGLPTKDDDPHLAEATGFKVPVTRLHPYSLTVKTVPPGSVIGPHRKARSWTLTVRGYLRHKP